MTRKNAALRRLGISSEDLEKVPDITSILKSAMGSSKEAIAVLRFSQEPCAEKFLKTYDSLPVGDRENLPIEAIAIEAGVHTSDLLGAALLACKTVRSQESALIAITAHPEVLKNTILYAGLPGGSTDRKMIHEAVGFLPTPKGVNMSVNLLGGNAQIGSIHQDGSEEDLDSQLFPSINEKLEKWGEDRRKMLSDGK